MGTYDEWKIIHSYPTLYSGNLMSCIYYNHNVYALGNFQTFAPFIDDPNMYRFIMSFNDLSHKWSILQVPVLTYSTQIPRMIMPAKQAGNIYIMGGSDENGDSINKVTEFEIRGNAYALRTVGSLLESQWIFMDGFIDERIYIIGGVLRKSFTEYTSVNMSECSTYIPTLHPTRNPTNPTMSPTHSPTTSPTHSPTSAPTDTPTQAPTLPPTIRDIVDFSLSEAQCVYIGIGVFVVVLGFCIFMRKYCCCKERRGSKNGVKIDIKF